MSFKHCLVVLGAITAMACGGSQQSGAGPTIASFTATPSSLPAAGGNVTLSWSVTGASALSIDQGVGDVSGLTSKVVSVNASKTFTMTATNSAGSNSERASVNVAATLTVTGKVLNAVARPVGGVAVAIPNHTSVNTDSDGVFAVLNVIPPYDVYIVDGPNKAITVYKGLSRPDPTLLAMDAFIGTEHTAQITGAVQRGAVGNYPQPMGHSTSVTISSPAEVTYQSGVQTNVSGSFTLMPQWFGPSSIQRTMHALQIRESAVPGIPADYIGYGRRDIAVSNGGVFSAQDITLGPVNTATLSGSVAAPPGYTILGKQVTLSSGIILIIDGSSDANFSYTVPVIPNSSIGVAALAGSPGSVLTIALKSSLAPNGSGVNLVARRAAEPSLPVDGATGVGSSTSFSWSAFSEGVHKISFVPRSPAAGHPSFYVFTTGASTTIPDGHSYGLPLPGGAAYQWKVEAFAPFSSIDAADTVGFVAPGTSNSPHEIYQSLSPARAFTTAP